MADVTYSSVCSSFDPDGGRCRLAGVVCPYVSARFRGCGDATFLAKVSMPPDEFNVLLNEERRPALGTLAVMKCRRPEYYLGVAGAHVNAVLESSGDGCLLAVEWHLDGSVEYFCEATDVRIAWREGKFIPL